MFRTFSVLLLVSDVNISQTCIATRLTFGETFDFHINRESGEVLTWLSVCVKVQIYIWPS